MISNGIVVDENVIIYGYRPNSCGCCRPCCGHKGAYSQEIIRKIKERKYILVCTENISDRYQNHLQDNNDFKQDWAYFEHSGCVKVFPDEDRIKLKKVLKNLNFHLRDYGFLISANYTKWRLIITEDLHFWDPGEKRTKDHDRQERVKNQNLGRVFKELKKRGFQIKNLKNWQECLSV